MSIAPAIGMYVYQEKLPGEVVFLLHSEATDGSTTFIDEKGHDIIPYNAHHSSAYAKFGNTSAKVAGNSIYIVCPASPDYAFGTLDFTVGFWALWTNSTASMRQVLATSLGSPSWGIYDQNQVLTVAGFPNSFSHNFELFTWHYVALCRSQGVIRFFLNGEMGANEQSNSSNFGASTFNTPLHIGGARNTNDAIYMEELRLIKGDGIYTSNFNVPTEPFPND